jgi:hypothetical protein
MEYKTEKVTIKGTSRSEVAAALMEIADFPRESFLGEISNIYKTGNSRKCSIAFHKETLDKLRGDVMEAVAYHGPHIIVGEILRSPIGNERDWQPTNQYAIEFDAEKIDPSLISRIENQIKSHY